MKNTLLPFTLFVALVASCNPKVTRKETKSTEDNNKKETVNLPKDEVYINRGVGHLHKNKYTYNDPTPLRILYLSTNGNDSVPKNQNSITSPWRTFAHAMYNLQAGDKLYIRGGNYSYNHRLIVRWVYGNTHYGGNDSIPLTATSGTQTNPVIVENYQDEEVVLESDYDIELDNWHYWTFRGLKFIGRNYSFLIGANVSTSNLKFENLTFEMSDGGDNVGALKFENSNADYMEVRNCDFTGPGNDSSIHLNTGNIYINRVRHIKVINNDFKDAPIGVYYKHANLSATASNTDIEISRNFFDNHSRSSMNYNANRSHVHHNVFAVGSTGGVLVSEANGIPGGDYNLFENNVFYGAALNLTSSTQSGDELAGAVGNIVRNNIFYKNIRVSDYVNINHQSVFTNNIYLDGAKTYLFGALYDFGDKTMITPTYEGGNSLSEYEDFYLDSSSYSSYGNIGLGPIP